MPRLYLSRIIGDGTPRTNPYRAKAQTHPFIRVRSLGIPTNPAGHPIRPWTVVAVWADDFAPFDADADMVALADVLDLDVTPNNGRRNQVNNVLGRLGVATRAEAGETYRTIANQLLTELGALERV